MTEEQRSQNRKATQPSGRRFFLAPTSLLTPYSIACGRPGQILESFARRGYALPDTPIMAFHRGSVARLEEHLRRDPSLLARRFTPREIYPPELGCPNDGRSGMHWTPISGTTLLHLSIDFAEREIFDWLLAHGADVNARAIIDADGFGDAPKLGRIASANRSDC